MPTLGKDCDELVSAAKTGDVAEVRRLLVSGTKVKDSLSLITAASKGHTEIIKILIEFGADVTAVDQYSTSALMKAAGSGHEDATRILADHILDVVTKQKLTANPIDYLHPYGTTALMQTAKNGRANAAQILLERGADPDFCNQNGCTAIEVAQQNNNEKVANLIQKWKDDHPTKLKPKPAPQSEPKPIQKHHVHTVPSKSEAQPAPIKCVRPVPLKRPEAQPLVITVVHEVPSKSAAQLATKPVTKQAEQISHGAVKGHVMISYQWGHQKELIKIRDVLRSRGYNVWMDIDHMSGSTLDAMAEAVEGAAVVLICFSGKYKESDNCKKEAKYADTLKKHIVPLRMESGYMPNGWLGLIVSDKLYFDFSGKYDFQKQVDALVKELGNRGKQ